MSSFGISGTNAHVILEEAPAVEPVGAAHGNDPVAVPWGLSARSAQALTNQARRLLAWVGADENVRPLDVGWSLVNTRSLFDHRAVVVGADRTQLMEGLTGLAAGVPGADVVAGRAQTVGKTAFVFPGQGAQWLGMGAQLCATAPVFAEHIHRCERALREHVEWSLLDVLRGAPGAPGLDRVDVVQPALWAVMVSLAELWRSVGVVPDAVIGHSQGRSRRHMWRAPCRFGTRLRWWHCAAGCWCGWAVPAAWSRWPVASRRPRSWRPNGETD